MKEIRVTVRISQDPEEAGGPLMAQALCGWILQGEVEPVYSKKYSIVNAVGCCCSMCNSLQLLQQNISAGGLCRVRWNQSTSGGRHSV